MNASTLQGFRMIHQAMMEDFRREGVACSHCRGPLSTLEDQESGECEQCWRDRENAQNEHDAEFDRILASEPSEPETIELSNDDLPF